MGTFFVSCLPFFCMCPVLLHIVFKICCHNNLPDFQRNDKVESVITFPHSLHCWKTWTFEGLLARSPSWAVAVVGVDEEHYVTKNVSINSLRAEKSGILKRCKKMMRGDELKFHAACPALPLQAKSLLYRLWHPSKRSNVHDVPEQAPPPRRCRQHCFLDHHYFVV